MPPLRLPSLRTLALALVAGGVALGAAGAQDPQQPPAGVRLSGEYGVGQRPGVLVLPEADRAFVA